MDARAEALPPEATPDALSLARRSAVEGLGTALLLATVVGSGAMAERLFADSAGLALLANSLATGGILVALIASLAPVSGAHLNPAVTFTDAALGGRPWRELPAYVFAQTVGAIAGVAAAQAMFGRPIFALSQRVRSGGAQVFSEALASFGLLAVIFLSRRAGVAVVALSVAAYVAAGYWFTSSTCFANPAVTLARTLTDTFTGIRPADVPGFLAGQAAGTAGFALFIRWLEPPRRTS